MAPKKVDPAQVAAEIASKALSPGVNDPGTAIDILTRLARVLSEYEDEASADQTPMMPRIWMTSVTADELVRDAFDPIARDGAGVIEIQIRLLKTLALLAKSGDATMAQAARAAAARALEYALPALVLEEHRERIKALAEKI